MASQATVAGRAAGWSETQLRALTAVFETFVPDAYDGESRRHAELAATALNEVAQPADLRQLRLVLDLLEARVGVPRVTGVRSFSRTSRERREHLLLHWSRSRIPQRRTFFHTVKRLACFFAFADPGVSGHNPRWTATDYSVPDHPLPPRNAVDDAILHVDDGAGALELSAEVVIVGSGAGGGVVAARLAEAGHEVLVVEAGPYVPEQHMPTDELAAFDRLYLDHGMTSTTDLGLPILAGAALGGGTLINWMTCIDPPDWVRDRWATEYGLEGFDGAPTDGDLARLRAELGFEHPATVGPKDQVILDGAAQLGWQAAPTERDGPSCGDCGACGFGCRRGTKRSGPRLHLATAAEYGTRLLPGAHVDRVVGLAGGGKLRVAGRLASGRPFEIRARRVVVAAGALRTPLVLMRSGLSHPAIGSNLFLHPTVVVAGRFQKRVAMWRDTMQAAGSTQFLRDGFLVESAPGHPGLIGLAFPWSGSAEFTELMSGIDHYAPLIGIVSDREGGRVSLSRSGHARISYRISKRDAAVARQALVAMARLTRAAGAERVVALGTPAAWHDVAPKDDAAWRAYLDRLAQFDFTPNRGSAFSAHQMGTARAAHDPRTSATDPWGRVRGARDLYVADTSLFPTSAGVNPMVTVMALAARVARAIHEDATSAERGA
jgi:choline dehydrogenase-like flavoprotein